MEKERKKKHHNGKRKIVQNDSSFEEKRKIQKVSKVKSISFPKELTQKRISLHSSNHFPIDIKEFEEMINIKQFTEIKEDNYFETVSQKREELKIINNEIDEQYNNKTILLTLLKDIENSKNEELYKSLERIREIYEEEENMKKVNDKINQLKILLEESELEKNK